MAYSFILSTFSDAYQYPFSSVVQLTVLVLSGSAVAAEATSVNERVAAPATTNDAKMFLIQIHALSPL